MEKVFAKTFLMNVTPSVANFNFVDFEVAKLCSRNCSYFLYLATLLTILGTAFLLKLLAAEMKKVSENWKRFLYCIQHTKKSSENPKTIILAILFIF